MPVSVVLQDWVSRIPPFREDKAGFPLRILVVPNSMRVNENLNVLLNFREGHERGRQGLLYLGSEH